MVLANYRISRHYSVYGHDDKLVINNSVWGFMSIDLAEIDSIELDHYLRRDDKEGLHFGYGDSSNIKLTFKRPQTYFGGLGQLTEQVDVIDMQVADPQQLADYVHSHVARVSTVELAADGVSYSPEASATA